MQEKPLPTWNETISLHTQLLLAGSCCELSVRYDHVDHAGASDARWCNVDVWVSLTHTDGVVKKIEKKRELRSRYVPTNADVF